jgi:hypothetical protein
LVDISYGLGWCVRCDPGGQSIVQDGDFKDSAGNPAKPREATCVQVSVSNTGTGSYKCMIDFADDRRESVDVTVSPDGSWVTS